MAKKYRLTVLLAVAVLFTLSACGGQDKAEDGTGTDRIGANSAQVATDEAASPAELDTIEGDGFIAPDVEDTEQPLQDEQNQPDQPDQADETQQETPPQEVEQPTQTPEPSKPAETKPSGGQTGQTNTKPSTGSSSTGGGSTPVPPGGATDSPSDSGIGEIDMGELNDWWQQQEAENGPAGSHEDAQHQFNPVQTQ